VLHLLTLDTPPVKGSTEEFFMRSSFYRLFLLSVSHNVEFNRHQLRGRRPLLGPNPISRRRSCNAPTAGAPTDTVSYWDGDHIGGKPSVKISLKEQRAYFYKSGMLVGISQLSTGREGLITPIGHFSIIPKGH